MRISGGCKIRLKGRGPELCQWEEAVEKNTECDDG